MERGRSHVAPKYSQLRACRSLALSLCPKSDQAGMEVLTLRLQISKELWPGGFFDSVSISFRMISLRLSQKYIYWLNYEMIQLFIKIVTPWFIKTPHKKGCYERDKFIFSYLS